MKELTLNRLHCVALWIATIVVLVPTFARADDETITEAGRALAADAFGEEFQIEHQRLIASPRGTSHLLLGGTLADGTSVQCTVDLTGHSMDSYTLTPPEGASIIPLEQEPEAVAAAEAARHMGDHAIGLEWRMETDEGGRERWVGEGPNPMPSTEDYEVRGVVAAATVEVDTRLGRVVRYSQDLPATTDPAPPAVDFSEAVDTAVQHMAPAAASLARPPILEYVPNGEAAWHVVLTEGDGRSEGHPQRIYKVDATTGDILEATDQKTVPLAGVKETRSVSEPVDLSPTPPATRVPTVVVALLVTACAIALGAAVVWYLRRRTSVEPGE